MDGKQITATEKSIVLKMWLFVKRFQANLLEMEIEEKAIYIHLNALF